MEIPAAVSVEQKFLGRGINYLGALGARPRDLQGFATLAFELIQNADDAPGATQIRFIVSDTEIVVANDAALVMKSPEGILTESQGSQSVNRSATVSGVRAGLSCLDQQTVHESTHITTLKAREWWATTPAAAATTSS